MQELCRFKSARSSKYVLLIQDPLDERIAYVEFPEFDGSHPAATRSSVAVAAPTPGWDVVFLLLHHDDPWPEVDYVADVRITGGLQLEDELQVHATIDVPETQTLRVGFYESTGERCLCVFLAPRTGGVAGIQLRPEET